MTTLLVTFHGCTSFVVLYVACFGVSFCAVFILIFLDNIWLGFFERAAHSVNLCSFSVFL